MGPAVFLWAALSSSSVSGNSRSSLDSSNLMASGERCFMSSSDHLCLVPAVVLWHGIWSNSTAKLGSPVSTIDINIAPALSAAIAFAAFFVTIYNVWSTRKHNRLTVQPRLTTFSAGPHDGDSTGTVVYTVGLKNSGLGPAIVKKFEVLIDGVAHAPTNPTHLREIVRSYLGVAFEGFDEFAVLRPEFVMAKDEEKTIAHVGLHMPALEVVEMLQRIHLRITFESAYGVIDCYESSAHHEGATDLSDLKLAARLLWQRLKTVAFNRVPVLKMLR